MAFPVNEFILSVVPKLYNEDIVKTVEAFIDNALKNKPIGLLKIHGDSKYGWNISCTYPDDLLTVDVCEIIRRYKAVGWTYIRPCPEPIDVGDNKKVNYVTFHFSIPADQLKEISGNVS